MLKQAASVVDLLDSEANASNFRWAKEGQAAGHWQECADLQGLTVTATARSPGGTRVF